MLPKFLSIIFTRLLRRPLLDVSIPKADCLSRSEEHVLVVDGSLAPPVQRLQLVFRVPGVRERVRVAEESPAAHRLAAPDVAVVRGGSRSAVWREGGTGRSPEGWGDRGRCFEAPVSKARL